MKCFLTTIYLNLSRALKKQLESKEYFEKFRTKKKLLLFFLNKGFGLYKNIRNIKLPQLTRKTIKHLAHNAILSKHG